ISDELLASTTKDPGHHKVLRELGMASAMVVPLTAGGRTFGALMLVSSDPSRLYDEDDLEFARHLGRRAAVAVDNSRLYRAAEERARAAKMQTSVDRKSTRLNSSHGSISYAVFCLKKKITHLDI